MFNALVDYEDPYVQPLLVAALKQNLPPSSFNFISSTPAPDQSTPLLQISSYESLDFEYFLAHPQSLCNAYIIRKALIRKHYLAQTILEWVTKHPQSPLKKHFTPTETLESDYAEFLDDAITELFDMRASFERNEGKLASEREWWIIKPSMLERGAEIRLFSTFDELQAIFDEWEPTEEEQDGSADSKDEHDDDPGAMISYVRYFVVQPYIHPPLLISAAPFRNRKFHIRTYVVAAGALRVYVYDSMLALFASEPYEPPWVTLGQASAPPSPPSDAEIANSDTELTTAHMHKMQNVHLTNTCMQTRNKSNNDDENDNVYLLSKLPLSDSQHRNIRDQIHEATSEVFRAALARPTDFQPLPNVFEIFGLDFLLEDGGNGEAGVNVQLLEVNAFPDFAQTGEELRDVVVKGLLEEIVKVVIRPFFRLGDGSEGLESAGENLQRLTKVLDVDMKRR